MIEGGEVWLRGAPHPAVSRRPPTRTTSRSGPRKLLLHRYEIERLIGRMQRKGLTLIPTRIYFKGPRAKVELALARGKEQRDRRREIQDRDTSAGRRARAEAALPVKPEFHPRHPARARIHEADG